MAIYFSYGNFEVEFIIGMKFGVLSVFCQTKPNLTFFSNSTNFQKLATQKVSKIFAFGFLLPLKQGK